MSTHLPFALSRATKQDMEAIVELQFECFQDPHVREIFMGRDKLALRERFVWIIQNDPTDLWVKVVEQTTNNIIAASNWKLNIVPEKHDTIGLDWLQHDPETKKRVQAIHAHMAANKARIRTYPSLGMC